MRLLRKIEEKIKKDKIKNEMFRNRLNVEPGGIIIEKGILSEGLM